MLENKISMKFGVEPGEFDKAIRGETIRGVCVKGAVSLRTQPEQHLLDQMDQVLRTYEAILRAVSGKFRDILIKILF